ncbi:hypothetical protein AV530_000869 [Patagioenas fasciata monilis]|uniref:Uncharacterized protein n=1 Tax=Patagioenas fasciata monilis TaxID=372326 RepID=A0A1V4KSH7_PATFA|nr:hypothetical protein AV530_000869 [Patagioenas fasciata monilis]
MSLCKNVGSTMYQEAGASIVLPGTAGIEETGLFYKAPESSTALPGMAPARHKPPQGEKGGLEHHLPAPRLCCGEQSRRL